MCLASASLPFPRDQQQGHMSGQAWAWLFVQLEETERLRSDLYCRSRDTRAASQVGQPTRKTPALFNPHWSCKQWHRKGTHIVLHLIKGEVIGMRLPEAANRSESLYFKNLNSASAFETKGCLGAGDGVRGTQFYVTLRQRSRQNWGLLNSFCNLLLKSQPSLKWVKMS